MLYIKQELFRKDDNLLDFALRLSYIINDEDFSGENGSDFISIAAEEKGYLSDFDYYFEKLYSELLYGIDLDEGRNFTNKLKKTFINGMFNEFIGISGNHYAEHGIEFFETPDGLFVTTVLVGG